MVLIHLVEDLVDSFLRGVVVLGRLLALEGVFGVGTGIRKLLRNILTFLFL